MVAMVALVFRIVASSAYGGKPFCSDSRRCVWFEASDTDGSVLKRNVSDYRAGAIKFVLPCCTFPL